MSAKKKFDPAIIKFFEGIAWMSARNYYTQLKRGQTKKSVVGGDVITMDNNKIGTVVWYDSKSGLAKVNLFKPLSCVTLVDLGISPFHIVYENFA